MNNVVKRITFFDRMQSGPAAILAGGSGMDTASGSETVRDAPWPSAIPYAEPRDALGIRIDSYASNVKQNHYGKFTSPFSLREKIRIRGANETLASIDIPSP